MDRKSAPYILLLGVLFGTSLVISRFGINQIPPTTFTGLRFCLASFAFVVIFSLQVGNRSWPKGKDIWRHSFLLGLFGTVIPITSIASALQYLSSGLVSILITIGPAFTVLMAHFSLNDEQINRRKGWGVLLAFGGAILLIILGESGLPNVGSANPTGYFLVFGGMLAGSAMTVYSRKHLQCYDTLDVTGVRLIFGAFILTPISFLIDGIDLTKVDYRGILALIFSAVLGSLLGMILSLYNVQRFGATASVMTSYVVPIVASLIGVIFLGEAITWGMIGGVVFIILGVWLIHAGDVRTVSEPCA